MLIGTGAIVLVLFCGCLALAGTVIGNSLTSLASSNNPGAKPTLPAGTQVAQTNPTFPVPQPTAYNTPPGGATPVGSSGTPAPTSTASPTPSVTDTPTPSPTGTGGGGNGPVTFHISPTDGVLTAGQTNQILLSGPAGTPVAVSIYFSGSTCLSKIVVLDGAGQGSLGCAIPAGEKGNTLTLDLNSGGKDRQYQIPVV
jgi:hypothetical protein